MRARPWFVSATVLLALTLALWADLRLQVSFGGEGWQLLNFSGPTSLKPNWDFLTFSGLPNLIQTRSAAGTPTTVNIPTATSSSAQASSPVTPSSGAKRTEYIPATNVFPPVDKSKTPTTTIVALLDSGSAKAMQDQLIPKEGTRSPYGLTFNLSTFSDQKSWSKSISVDPGWKDRYEDIVYSTYHPCCGVTISTNDCGHAVALTGLVKKMLQDGKSNQDIRTELLLWERYFFPRHYVIMGLAVQKAGRSLDTVDLSQNYSTVQSERNATDYLIY